MPDNPIPNVTRFGPGYSANSAASPAQDPSLPNDPLQGDPCFNTPEPPWKGKNAQSAGTTAGVQKQTINEPHGTRGQGQTHQDIAPI